MQKEKEEMSIGVLDIYGFEIFEVFRVRQSKITPLCTALILLLFRLMQVRAQFSLSCARAWFIYKAVLLEESQGAQGLPTMKSGLKL